MKKILFVLAVAIFFIQAPVFSQKARVGATAGLTFSNQSGTVNNVDVKGDAKAGFTTGIFVDIPLGKSHVSFQPSVHYMQKGKVLSETKTEKRWLALRYAETQFNFVYNSNTTTNFFIGAGPAVSFDMPSKTVTRTSNATALDRNPKPKYSRVEQDVILGNESPAAFKGIDFGANVLLGFRLKKGYQFSVNYTYGIRNLVVGDAGNNDIRNSCIGISFGYLFSNK
jgi:hypothetical protein